MSDFIPLEEDTSDIQSIFLCKNNTQNPEIVNCPIHINYDDSGNTTQSRLAQKGYVDASISNLINNDSTYVGGNFTGSLKLSNYASKIGRASCRERVFRAV